MLEGLLAQLAAGAGADAAAAVELAKLREELEAAAAEAAANASQLREESARLAKRSSSAAQARAFCWGGAARVPVVCMWMGVGGGLHRGRQARQLPG